MIQPEQKYDYDVNASIVLYKTPTEEINRCIKNLLSSNYKINITLINNSGSSQSYPEFISNNITIIEANENLGYGKGHNVALIGATVSCRYNLVLNSDLYFTGNDIDKLLRFMDANNEVGMVAPRITYPDGEIQKLCRLLPSPLTVFGRAFFPFMPVIKTLDRKYQFEDWSYADFGNFPYLSGCFMLIRRAVIEKIGGFDERFFMFFEDVDFSRRIHTNYKTIFHPGVTIQHEYRSRQKINSKLVVYKIISAMRYFFKWGWLFDEEGKKINDVALRQFKGGISPYK